MKLWMIWIAAVVGCAHHADTKSEARASGGNTAGAASQSTSAANPAAARTCANDLDCGANQLCIRGACVGVTAELAECSALRVHFAFNSSEIDSPDKSALERSARCLRADHALHVTIEGNTDERGTEEYNLALGDRRATTIANWLMSLGVSSTQLKTVSFGKENPVCPEHDEECWAKNRRAAVKPKVSSAR